jgi:class 3 adenylate cyclase
MDEYTESRYLETESSVRVDNGGVGVADVSVTMVAGDGDYRAELTTRVGAEDLPRLVDDLVACLTPEGRAALLIRLFVGDRKPA